MQLQLVFSVPRSRRTHPNDATSNSNSNSSSYISLGLRLFMGRRTAGGDSLMYSPGGAVAHMHIGSCSRLSSASASVSACGSAPRSGSGSQLNSESRNVFGSYRDGSRYSTSTSASAGDSDLALASVPPSVSVSVRPMSLFSTVITGGASVSGASSGSLAPSTSSSSVALSGNGRGAAVSAAAVPTTMDADPVGDASATATIGEGPCSALMSALDRCFASPTNSPVHAGVRLAELVLAQSLSLVEKDRLRHGTSATGTGTAGSTNKNVSASKRAARMQSKLDQSHEAVSVRLRVQLSGNGNAGLGLGLGVFSRKLSQLWSLCAGLSYHVQLLRLLCAKPVFPSLAKPALRKDAPAAALRKKSAQELGVSWRAVVKNLKKALVRHANSRLEGTLSRLSILLSSYASFSQNFSDNITFGALSAGGSGSVETVGDIHCLPFLLCASPPAGRSPSPGPDEVITSTVLVNNCTSMVQLLDYVDGLSGGSGSISGDAGLFSTIAPHCAIISALAEHHPRFSLAGTALSGPGIEHQEGDVEGEEDVEEEESRKRSAGAGRGAAACADAGAETAGSDGSVVSLVERSCSVESGAGGDTSVAVAAAASAALGLSYPKMMLPLPAPVPVPVPAPAAAAGVSTVSPTGQTKGTPIACRAAGGLRSGTARPTTLWTAF